jgi:hypothetical protein
VRARLQVVPRSRPRRGSRPRCPRPVAVLLALAAPSAAARAQAATVPLGAFFWQAAPNDEAAFAGIQRGLAAGGVECTWTVQRAGGDPVLA